ncbi:hypothetical protein KW803_00705 [Candidatus Saccharibacteria bacterium]|nr:hypothetical protein [Candidatus Saccharibacteria bacterium]
MSKVIAAILGQSEQLVSKTIGRLEDKNGYPSHDVRHLADNIQKTRVKVAELGLDPNDTTGEELYQALLIKFHKDSRQFDTEQRMEANDFESKAARAVQIISDNFEMPERWSLKTSVAKDLLRQNPPKRIMKQLNYRSIESMVKREELSSIFVAASLLESASWQKQIAKHISKQDSAKLIPKRLDLIALSFKKWGQLETNQPVIHNDDIGVIALAETHQAPEMPLLSMVIALTEVLSSFGQLNQSKVISKLSPALAWWSDMDSLISNYGDEHVSLNINDVNYCKLNSNDYSQRVLDNSRDSFWRGLIERYDNQLAIDEDVLSGLKNQLIGFKAPRNQPAFEYVENY